MVQIQPFWPTLKDHATGFAWECFRPLCFRGDLNNPPTAVGGIQELGYGNVCRPDLNNPPTAVGGIQELGYGNVCRLDLRSCEKIDFEKNRKKFSRVFDLQTIFSKSIDHFD